MDELIEIPPNNEKDGEQKIPESPKPTAFTIDFGGGKSVDTQRHKSLVEKYQKRHRRGQSLSKLEDSTSVATPPQAPIKKHPLSANLPRKANLHSESGYLSSEEKNEKVLKNARSLNNVKMRDGLSLPLRNVNSDKMSQSCGLPCIESPDIEIADINAQDLDLVSPFSPQEEDEITPNSVKLCRKLSSPETEIQNQLDNDDDQFVDSSEFDFDISDTVSDAGTYTLDADNYSEEQKERMSIDKEFKIQQMSVFEKTQEYVQSLAAIQITKISQDEQKVQNVEELFSNAQKPQTLSFAQNNSQRNRNKLSPIVSPTQNISIIQNSEKQVTNPEEPSKVFTKIMFPSPKARTGIGLEKAMDHGNIISVTSSGAFRSKPEIERAHRRKLSLTKSEVHVETYTVNPYNAANIIKQAEIKPKTNLSANLVLVSENLPQTVNNIKSRNGSDRLNEEEIMQTNVPVGKVVNLPPPIGGVSGKNSPTKIPSPIHTSRPRSRNSSNSLNMDLSDSSLETESYLKPTQCLLNSLQQRLSLDSDHEYESIESKYLNNDARNLLKKPTHMRHNSLDDRNLKISNKLEHFQNKNLIDQTYTNVLNQYSHGKVHKIQNSPNNSPIRRSSSFSTKNQINTKYSNIPQKESNLRNSPNLGRNGSIQRSSSTATMRSSLLLRRSSINSDHKIDRNQFGDTESSSEEDLKQNLKKKDITNTRYNRAFSLRRGRLESEPTPPPRCPNTPEMRRKFQPDTRAERAISVDRKPMKAVDVQSRYMQSISKTKNPVIPAKVEAKGSPKIGNSVTKPAPKQQVFSRTDTGRFSMRTTKPPVTNSQKTIRKETQGKKPSGPRSNSSLTSKEVEFQNWKRRKSYDPMKAAAEGKRKAELAKKQTQNPMTQSYHEANQDCDSSPSHSSSVHRSQSFHGTAALEQFISSEEEEDLTLSADEGFSPPTPSPCDMSPNRVNLRYAWKDQLLH